MKKETATFLKTVFIFTISPGFAGIIFFLSGFFLDMKISFNKAMISLDYIIGSIVFGFVGGIIFYATPAFILGFIYASLDLKKNLRSYLFIILFSPIFLFIFDYILDYLFTTNRKIPFSMKVEKTSLIFIMCPLASIASFIAAWISLPRD